MGILKHSKKREEERTWYRCEACNKPRWHDVKHDGLYEYYICQSCGHSVEFRDHGK